MGGMAEAQGPKRKAREDVDAIQADVGSFAASLGLPAAVARGFSSGFDDSDFRKKGRIGAATDLHSSDVAGKKGSKVRSKKTKETSPDHDASGKSKRRHTREPEKREEGTGKEKRAKNRNEKLDKKCRRDGQRSDVQDNKGQDVQRSKIHEVLDGALVQDPKENGLGRKKQRTQPSNRNVSEFSSASQVESDQRLREEAQQLMEKAVQKYERSRSKDTDAQWLMKARRSGTSTDKVAAMTVMLQENPQANLRTLDALIGMLTSKAGKRHAGTGIDALKELFIYNLLPDRKLKYFSQQPAETLSESKTRGPALIEWYWEDCLKRRYESFVMALEEATKDSLYFLKEKALKTVFELLKSKPEQERRLLSTLVNKLGDPERKMASNASYLLSCLLSAHPNMKEVVVGDVETFVFRPHVGLRARYYAAIFLNQIVLSNNGNGPLLAKQLIQLYLTLFKVVTSVVDDKNGENEQHKGKKSIEKKKSERKKPGGPHRDQKQEQSADFTNEIDSRILSALLTGINRALPFVRAEDLDSLTQDNNVLFRMVHSSNFNLAVQALMLLHQLLTRSQAVSDRFYRALYSVLLSKGLAKSSKAEMFLGLFFKALKTDVDFRRMAALAKRLLQVSLHLPPQFACGSLLLLSEVLKTKPNLWSTVLQTEDADGEERFTDVRDEEDLRPADEETKETSVSAAVEGGEWPQPGSYDSKHRDPLYCNAHRTCWWELAALACHVHPSVAVMARTLLSGANIVYKGDPLRDLSLGVFLDRYTEKKPKTLKEKQPGTWHGSSLTPPSRSVGDAMTRPLGEEFSLLGEDQVAPEDLVFHRYYVAKVAQAKRIKPKTKRKGQDEDDVTEGLLGDDAFAGDDSEDEEVEALLEKEVDLEMDESDLSGDDAADTDVDDDDMSVDEEEGGNGSDVDDFDVSDDEEAGLEMISDDEEEAGLELSSDAEDGVGISSDDESVDGRDARHAVQSSRSKAKDKQMGKSKGAKEFSAGRRQEKRVDKKAKKENQNPISKRAARVDGSKQRNRSASGRASSVFQEAPADDEF